VIRLKKEIEDRERERVNKKESKRGIGRKT
jgi:hypothetical protein